MGQYAEKNNFWKTAKLLTFLANLIRNHNRTVNDHDIFVPAGEQVSPEELRELVMAEIPSDAIEEMKGALLSINRLDFNNESHEIMRQLWRNESARKPVRKIIRGIADRYLKRHPLDLCRGEHFAQRCSELQKTFGLSDFELDVILVLAFIHTGQLRISDCYNRRIEEYDKADFIAKCLNSDIADVLDALSAGSRLRRYECVDYEFDFNPSINSFLNGTRSEPLTSVYFSRCRDEEVLPWHFFGDLAEKHGTILKRIINSADGRSPVNILFYGQPGTGKTSFAKTIAAELKRDCFVISSSSRMRAGEAVGTPAFRFAALQVCSSKVDPARSIIIVDEADSMLRSSSDGLDFFGRDPQLSSDKGMLNSMLDTVTTPTIWITNTRADALDESSRRRFDYSIRFDPLTTKQRLSIWSNSVKKFQLDSLVSPAMMTRFAARYPVSAGGISLTLQNLAKLATDRNEAEQLVETLMRPHCELLGLADAADVERPANDYTLEGLNIKGALSPERLVEAVRCFRQNAAGGIDSPRMNILLSGAPGTGKTEFVKYLGAQLNAKVVVKMGSDLLNMYVGSTEKAIRQAFAQAEEEQAILFFDEIDGIMQNRERAHRNWEVTQVNELLHRMENFSGVMVGATNFAAHLDAAVLRRFTYKLEFDYLDASGKKIFFERMFNTQLTRAEAAQLADIPRLTPGDFRTVRQGFFYLGGDVSNAERLAALKNESDIKSANRCSDRCKIGF